MRVVALLMLSCCVLYACFPDNKKKQAVATVESGETGSVKTDKATLEIPGSAWVYAGSNVGSSPAHVWGNPQRSGKVICTAPRGQRVRTLVFRKDADPNYAPVLIQADNCKGWLSAMQLTTRFGGLD